MDFLLRLQAELGDIVAEQERNHPTRCNTLHAGMTCDEYDTFMFDLAYRSVNPWRAHATIAAHRESQKRLDDYDPLG
jgi:hypothetical protein